MNSTTRLLPSVLRRYANLVTYTLLFGLLPLFIMTCLTLNFSNALVSVPFHLSFIIPLAYLCLLGTAVATSIRNELLARFFTVLVWFIPAAILFISYLTYYISITNWGLPMNVVMLKNNLSELTYIVASLPFNATLVYLTFFTPLAILLTWYIYGSGKLPDEMRLLTSNTKKSLGRKVFLIALLVPIMATAAIYATPYYQAHLARRIRGIEDPLVAMFNLKGVNKSQLIPDMGEAHLMAEKRYPTNLETSSKNVILIICDALRADHLSAYGYHRPTAPFLDSLVGLPGTYVHPRYFSNTGVSFTGITTSLSSTEHLTMNNFTVHEVLRKQGFATNFILSGDFTHFYNLRSYLGENVDQYSDGFTYRQNPYAGKSSTADDQTLVLKKLQRLSQSEGEKNFFYLHYMSAHQGGAIEDHYRSYKPDEFSLIERAPPHS